MCRGGVTKGRFLNLREGGTLFLLFLAWALRLYRLDGQSLWYDEGYSVFLAGKPLIESLRWYAGDFTPPLYGALLTLWLPLAGRSEFAVRFPSVLAGLLTVAWTARLGWDLARRAVAPKGRWAVGFLAGLLAALSPFYLWHSQDARMYMPQAVAGLAATTLLLRALRAPHRRRRWLAFALAEAAALYLHTTSGFLFAFHLVVVLGSRGAIKLRPYLALAGALLIWLPWLLYALPFLGQNAGYWPGRLDWRFLVSRAFRGFVSGGMLPEETAGVAALLWAAVMLLSAALLLGQRSPAGGNAEGRPALESLLFLAGYLAVPLALMAVLFRSVPKFAPRYLIIASPPLFLLPGLGIGSWLGGDHPSPGDHLRRAVAGLLLAPLLVVAGLGLHNLYANPAFAKPDFRAAARRVRQAMAPDEIVLLVSGHFFPVWEYYFGPQGWAGLPDDPVLNVNHVLHYREAVQRLNPLLRGRSGVWLVQWQDEVVDPTGVVPYLLEQVGEAVPVAPPAPLPRLRHYRLPSAALPLPPEPQVPPAAQAEPVGSDAAPLPLRLRGCRVPPETPGDRPLTAHCFWEASGPLPLHLYVSARLVDEAGIEWGRADGPISGPYLVAGRWPQGEPILGRYQVRPTPGTPPGAFYRLDLRLYEPDGTVRGVVSAGPVTVDRPLRPYTGTLVTEAGPVQRLGGLALLAARVEPEHLLPGETATVEAAWEVRGAFREPRLRLEDARGEAGEAVPLLPEPGAMARWRVGDRYRTVTRLPISPHAWGGETTVWAVAGEERVALGRLWVEITRTFALPTTAIPLAYRLGEEIALVGVRQEEGNRRPGEAVSLVLYWRAEGEVGRSYKVFVHLVGPDGQIHGQVDRFPQGGRHPTDHWLPGEVVEDRYRVLLPTDAPTGAYTILVGLYDPADPLARLPVHNTQGERLPHDAIPVGHFTVVGD